jgi:hypothetical protein
MSQPVHMNATDYLMSVFDWHLRSAGHAGNLSHLVFAVATLPDRDLLQTRLSAAAAACPMLAARPKRTFFSRRPYWRLPDAGTAGSPEIQWMRAADGQSIETLREDALNRALASNNGKLIRFTVIEGGDRTEVVLTWAHALMDARGAETFLSMIGGEPPAEAWRPEAVHTRRVHPSSGTWPDMKASWKVLRWFDRIGKPPPLSLYTARADRAKPRQVARLLSFTSEETAAIRKNSSAMCGFLGETAYLLAATLFELKRLCDACGIPAETYLVNLPFDARNKGSREPVFSNFSSFIVHYLRKNQLDDMSTAAQAIQFQTRESMEMGFAPAFDSFGSLVRHLPPRLYWSRMKIAFNNEIASLFFANTGNAPQGLDRFLGQEVLEMHHATSVTCPPGIGVFFHTFKGRLRCTLSLVGGLLSEDELSRFLERLRQRLLEPTGNP